MAITNVTGAGTGRLDPFVRVSALLMALILVAGFSTQFLAGRSTFQARLLVHVHGVAFFAWVALFVAQVWLVRSGDIARHRMLGIVGAAWVPVLLVLGTALTVDVVRRSITPPFFNPQHFLIANPLGVLAFAGLTGAALLKRREPDWHRRLHVSALALLLGPGVGRLLPMPLIGPYGFEISAAVGLAFIVAGMIWDRRTQGRIHAAWTWSLTVGVGWLVSAQLIARSVLGDSFYAWVTDGAPGAAIPGFR
jgi:hypothetical protein